MVSAATRTGPAGARAGARRPDPSGRGRGRPSRRPPWGTARAARRAAAAARCPVRGCLWRTDGARPTAIGTDGQRRGRPAPRRAQALRDVRGGDVQEEIVDADQHRGDGRNHHPHEAAGLARHVRLGQRRHRDAFERRAQLPHQLGCVTGSGDRLTSETSAPAVPARAYKGRAHRSQRPRTCQRPEGSTCPVCAGAEPGKQERTVPRQRTTAVGRAPPSSPYPANCAAHDGAIAATERLVERQLRLGRVVVRGAALRVRIAPQHVAVVGKAHVRFAWLAWRSNARPQGAHQRSVHASPGAHRRVHRPGWPAGSRCVAGAGAGRGSPRCERPCGRACRRSGSGRRWS